MKERYQNIKYIQYDTNTKYFIQRCHKGPDPAPLWGVNTQNNTIKKGI